MTLATWLASVLLGVVVARIVIIVCRRAAPEKHVDMARSKSHRPPFPPTGWRL